MEAETGGAASGDDLQGGTRAGRQARRCSSAARAPEAGSVAVPCPVVADHQEEKSTVDRITSAAYVAHAKSAHVRPRLSARTPRLLRRFRAFTVRLTHDGCRVGGHDIVQFPSADSQPASLMCPRRSGVRSESLSETVSHPVTDLSWVHGRSRTISKASSCVKLLAASGLRRGHAIEGTRRLPAVGVPVNAAPRPGQHSRCHDASSTAWPRGHRWSGTSDLRFLARRGQADAIVSHG